MQDRLEMMWLTDGGVSFENRIKKALEIIGGWEQYFRGQRKIGGIIEYAAVVYAAQGDGERLEELRQQRFLFENPYRDLYRKYFHLETSENAVELMQCYTDLQVYDCAQFWMKKKEELEKTGFSSKPALVEQGQPKTKLRISKITGQKFRRLFVGREDIYAKEVYDRTRRSELQTLPLTEKEITAHLQGEMTVGTYIQRPNGTVRFIVFDVDVSKHILLKYGQEPEVFRSYYEKARLKSVEICEVLKKLGLKGYLEDSGNRGYHVWVFLSEWITVRYANLFCKVVQTKFTAGGEGEISLECFPNKTRLKPGKYGQVLKLPYGIHGKSGRRSYFLDEEFRPVMEPDAWMDSVAPFSLTAIKRVLAANTGIEEQEVKKVVDEDLEAFGMLSPSVLEILNKRNLMCYLCQKARKTGYLTHFERLSVLYVFAHIGEERLSFIKSWH